MIVDQYIYVSCQDVIKYLNSGYSVLVGYLDVLCLMYILIKSGLVQQH